jgi:probable F420-dependent oxidoreductase
VTEPNDQPLFGVSLLRVNPSLWSAVAQEAEQLGFESVWMSDHLALPAVLDSSDYPDGELPINPRTPIFDVMVHLAALAAQTTSLRLGTYIYQPALRPAFVAARAITTLDVVSSGRLELGVGVGWSKAEWDVSGVSFANRGARLDEWLDVFYGLWTGEPFEYAGKFAAFPPVVFQPTPHQQPGPPLHIGGESDRALRRAVERGDGWIGMHHTPASVAEPMRRVASVADALGRTTPLVTTVASHPGKVDVAGWRRSGVSRVIVAPWSSSRDALDGLRRFARQHLRT